MKVFISWSGERSKMVASALRGWLTLMFETIQPWMSSTDIGKGTRWADEISRQLENSDVGIVCVTPENMQNPWLLFESGAIVKKVNESLLCTLVIGMQKSAIKGPLSQFQHTEPKEADMLEFVRTLNRAKKTPRSEIDVLFKNLWPELKAKLDKVPDRPSKAEQSVEKSLKYYQEKAIEVEVRVTPQSADLFFNDRLVGQSPQSIRVNPDATINTVSAAAINYFDWHSPISKEEIERRLISIKLDHKQASDWGRHVPRWLRDRRRYPDNPVLTRAIVTYLCFINEVDDAVAEAEIAVGLAPNWYMSYNAMGFALLKKQDIEAAARYFRITSTMKPDSFAGHYNLAAALSLQKKFAECIVNFKHILNNRRAWITFAEADVDVASDSDFDNIRSDPEFKSQFDKICKQISEAVSSLSSEPDAAG